MEDENVDTTAERTTDNAPVADRLDKIESLLLRAVEVFSTPKTPAPAPEPEPAPEPADSSEADALRARIAAMESTMARMASEPIRRGRPHMAQATRNAPKSGYDSMIRSCEEFLPSGSALAAVCREQAPSRAAGLSALPTRSELERDLRAVLHAALVDGVITDPDTRGNWS
jgi:hypothetical protein